MVITCDTLTLCSRGSRIGPLTALFSYLFCERRAVKRAIISMTFFWLADDGPILNAGTVALWFFRGSGLVLLRKPIFTWVFNGPEPLSPPPLDPPMLYILYIFSCYWCRLPTFFFFFQKYISGPLSECQTGLIQIMTDTLSVLIYVQIVCISYRYQHR